MTTFLLPTEIWDVGRGANALADALADTRPSDRIFVPGYVIDTRRFPETARVIRVDVGQGFIDQDTIEVRLRQVAEDPNAVVMSSAITAGVSKVSAPRNHRVHHVGKLKVVTIGATTGSYRAQWLRDPGQGSWITYGSGQPIFTRNTSRFDEASPSRCDTYVVLASGLLGLKMIVDSRPDPDARIVVFDINPNQLVWSQFVIAHAGGERDFTALNAAFQNEHPQLSLRPVLPHERANAGMQDDWFTDHYRDVAALGDHPITWIRANLLHDPDPVLSQLSSKGRTFFMYLDIFLPWLHADGPPTVLDLHQLAAEFRAEVIDRTNTETQFLPRRVEHEIQLSDQSPWHEP